MFNSNNPYAPNNFPDPNNPYNAGNQYPYGAANPVVGPYRRQRSRISPGCLLFPVAAVLLAAGAILYLSIHPNYAIPLYLFFLQQSSSPAVLLGGFGVILALAWLQRLFRRTVLGSLLGGVFNALMFVGIVALVCWALFINAYTIMTPAGFLSTPASIRTGDVMRFENAANNATQVLCIGVNQHCQSEKGAPNALQQGIRVLPGQTVNVTFNTEGTYHITSENTPNMNFTVIVTVPDNSDTDG